jgi:hypothetical protein
VLDAIRQLPGCSGASSEHLTYDGLFSIDIAVLLPDDKLLAVEVEGPTHFLSSAPTVPNGATRLRNRLLEARGWRVVSVPVTEWHRQVGKGRQAVHKLPGASWRVRLRGPGSGRGLDLVCRKRERGRGFATRELL